MAMIDDVKRRLPKRSDAYVDAVVHIIEMFSLSLTIRNFINSTFSFQDEDGRTVELVEANIRAGSLGFQPNTPAETLVFTSEGVVIGWARTAKASRADIGLTLSIKTVEPLPAVNQFRQQCTHMSEHGGWYDGNAWECLGCGAELVFNDRQFAR